MKFVILSLLAASQIAFASGAELECEVVLDERQSNLTTIEIANLVNCDFIRTGTVCDYVEGHDRFSAMNFEPAVISSAKAGDQIQGWYVNGYVHKTWVVESEVPMTCWVK